jgi:hypothetical protein
MKSGWLYAPMLALCALAFVCGVPGTADRAHAQQPAAPALQKITPRAVFREAPLPPQLSQAARAALASRIVGRVVPIDAVTGTAAVTPDAPRWTPPSGGRAQLTLSAYEAYIWQTDPGGRGYINLSPTPAADDIRTRSRVMLTFAAAAEQRYLVLCDLNRGAIWRVLRGGERAEFTWESDSRGALLIPPQRSAGDVRILIAVDESPPGSSFSTGGSISRCEISAIRL